MFFNPFFIPRPQSSYQRSSDRIRSILLKEILSDELNYVCFDCHRNLYRPQNFSINNGIILCNNCALNHSNFPKFISIVKHCNIEELTNEELMLLYYGGNRKLDEFIEYEYPKLQNMKINIMYKTEALEYYRQNLRSLAFGEPKSEKPNEHDAYKYNKKILKIEEDKEKEFFGDNYNNEEEKFNNNSNFLNPFQEERERIEKERQKEIERQKEKERIEREKQKERERIEREKELERERLRHKQRQEKKNKDDFFNLLNRTFGGNFFDNNNNFFDNDYSKEKSKENLDEDNNNYSKTARANYQPLQTESIKNKMNIDDEGNKKEEEINTKTEEINTNKTEEINTNKTEENKEEKEIKDELKDKMDIDEELKENFPFYKRKSTDLISYNTDEEEEIEKKRKEEEEQRKKILKEKLKYSPKPKKIEEHQKQPSPNIDVGFFDNRNPNINQLGCIDMYPEIIKIEGL